MKSYKLLYIAFLCLIFMTLAACRPIETSPKESALPMPQTQGESQTPTDEPWEETETQEPETIPAETYNPETDPPETDPVETRPLIPEEDIHTVKLTVKGTGEVSMTSAELKKNAGANKTRVRVLPSVGYACTGVRIGDTSYEGNTLMLSDIPDDMSVTVLVDYATFELPIVHISVDGQKIVSKTEYIPMRFTMENTERLFLDIPGGIRLRGNSTADQIKKPYRIKFEQKQALFGLEKEKSWVLLAEFLDPSCLHNYAAMYLGAASDELAFTPTIHHVNLYLDGAYMGLYSLCEQVEEERLGLEQAITPQMQDLMDFSFLVRMDERAPEEDEPYFYVASVGRYFQLKYPAPEDFSNQRQFRKFMLQLEAYYNDMADAFKYADNGWIKSNIHIGGLIDHLIIDQIMGEKDHVWKSFYSYHDAEDEKIKGKISFGPIWDYDYSLFVPWTNRPNQHYEVDMSVTLTNFFYKGLMKSRYQVKVESRYQDHYARQLEALIQHLHVYRDSIKESLALNQERWYYFIDPDLTEDNFDFLIRFLEGRLQVLEKAWG